MLTALVITSIVLKQRNRKGEERRDSGEDTPGGRQEWQKDNWRRNSNKWPPESPPIGSGPQQNPLTPSPSSGGLPCPPPIPAPPSEPQEDLNKDRKHTASPIPRRLNQRSRSGNTAMPRGPNRASTPRGNRHRQQQPEDSGGLRVPDGAGSGQRSRSSSPYEVWGTPEEHWGPESGLKNIPSPASESPSLRRRGGQGGVSDNSDVFQCDESQATDADEVRPSTPLAGERFPQDTTETNQPSENCQIVVIDNSGQDSHADSNNADVVNQPSENCQIVVIDNSEQDSNVDSSNADVNINGIIDIDSQHLENSNSSHLKTISEAKDSDMREPPNDCENSSPVEEASKRDSPIPKSKPEPPSLHLFIPPANGAQDISASDDYSMCDEEEDDDGDDEQTNESTEVANDWAHLLGDALSGSLANCGDMDDDMDDDDYFDSSKNAFYQDTVAPELFQGSNIAYMPSSKEDFLKKQQDEDEKYIMDALNQEREELMKMSEEEEEEEEVEEDTDEDKKDDINEVKEEKKDVDDVHAHDIKDTNHLNASEDEVEDRAWSPGPPVFKSAIEEHLRTKQQEIEAEEEGRGSASEDEEETPWWERRRPVPAVVPAAPPMPGKIPPPPPLFGATKVNPGATMPKMRKERLDSIRKAVRTRPDWHTLMKDVEGGVKLKHVADRSDRSRPVLPGSRGKNGKFVYESEKPTVVNELLHEIQRGVKLRHSRTNDRSRPDFSKLGLKKFRRQLTMEEKKSLRPEDPENLPSSSDDEEDIDCMRDDLTATKTQLADEMKKCKKLEREKKVVQIDIESMQSEMKKLRRLLREAGIHDKPIMNGEDEIMPKLEKSMSKLRMSERNELDFGELDNIEGEIKQLNGKIDAQRMRGDGFESKVIELEQKLIVSESGNDEWEGRAIFFEKKYKALQRDQHIELPDISMASVQTDPIEFVEQETEKHPHPIDGFGSSARKSGSRRSFASQINRMESFQEEMDGDSSSSSEEESEEEEEEDEMYEGEEGEEEGDDDEELTEEKLAKQAEKEAKRIARDSEFWKNKLEHAVAREINVKTERNNLQERIKKFYKDMYQERVEYLKSKAELDELVNGLKDPNEEPEEDEDDDEEEEVHPADEEPGWWFDKPNLKPKKLKKKTKNKLNADGEVVDEEEEEEEDLEDLTQLEEPCWSDSEQDQSDEEDENDSAQVKLNFLQSRTKRHEDRMVTVKKNNYLLKTEADRCKEKFGEERLRRRRLNEELNMLVSDMQ